MGRTKKKGLVLKPFCYYCEKECDDEAILHQHQKNRHFGCTQCKRTFSTATAMAAHLLQVHKETLTRYSLSLLAYPMPSEDATPWMSRFTGCRASRKQSSNSASNVSLLHLRYSQDQRQGLVLEKRCKDSLRSEELTLQHAQRRSLRNRGAAQAPARSSHDPSAIPAPCHDAWISDGTSHGRYSSPDDRNAHAHGSYAYGPYGSAPSRSHATWDGSSPSRNGCADGNDDAAWDDARSSNGNA